LVFYQGIRVGGLNLSSKSIITLPPIQKEKILCGGPHLLRWSLVTHMRKEC